MESLPLLLSAIRPSPPFLGREGGGSADGEDVALEKAAGMEGADPHEHEHPDQRDRPGPGPPDGILRVPVSYVGLFRRGRSGWRPVHIRLWIYGGGDVSV